MMARVAAGGGGGPDIPPGVVGIDTNKAGGPAWTSLCHHLHSHLRCGGRESRLISGLCLSVTLNRLILS